MVVSSVTLSMPEQSNDYRVVVFGAGGVGKTSLVLRFINGTFRDSYIPTIEDTYRKVVAMIASTTKKKSLQPRLSMKFADGTLLNRES